jgi:hypothetical protein
MMRLMCRPHPDVHVPGAKYLVVKSATTHRLTHTKINDKRKQNIILNLSSVDDKQDTVVKMLLCHSQSLHFSWRKAAFSYTMSS